MSEVPLYEGGLGGEAGWPGQAGWGGRGWSRLEGGWQRFWGCNPM